VSFIRSYLALILFGLMILSAGCNNPSGGSVVSINHTPLLDPPGVFSFTQVRAANGNVNLKWRGSERADNYKVYQGTTNFNVTTPVTSCDGNIVVCNLTGLVPTTILYFKVISSNAAGTETISANAPALSVTSFDTTGSSVADGQFNVTWNASTGATSYNVLYGTSPGSYSNSISGVTSPYSITGLSNDVTYYVRIVAVNAFNGYALSDSERNGKPFGPPPAPSGIALAASSGQMLLNWNSAIGANSYKVFRGTTSGLLTEIANGIVGNTYTDTTTADGTTYFYALKAFNSYDSVLSSEVSARSISPFNITSVTVGPAAAQLTVNWPLATGASAYDIRYGTNPASLNLTASNVTSPHVLSGLTGGTTYYFRVLAKNTIGVGMTLNSTNQLSGTPIASIAAPTGLTATGTPGQVALNWNVVSGASSYEVLRGTVSGTYASLQAGIVGNTYNDTTVADGTTYFYVVRSFNGLNSVNSSEVSKKTVQSFSISSINIISNSSLQISWPAAAGADAYDVRYGTVSGSYTGTATGVTSPYTLTGLAANTIYYIVVRGRNAVGTGTIFQAAEDSGKTKTAIPTGLVALTSPGQASLNWNNVVGATTYSVYRGTVSGTRSLLINGLATSNYIDATVADGTTYFYTVRADNGTESADSSEISARSISAFTITSTNSPGTTSISVTWPSTTGAATYDIQYGTSSGSYTSTVTNRTSPSTLTGLTSGITYYIRVIAKNAVGSGSTEYSNEESQGTPVGPPTGVLATVANAQITLSWNPMSGASSYKVYRGTVSGAYAEIANGVVATNYVDTGVTDGTVYYYVIKSFNGADSTNSLEVTGKTISAFSISSLTALSSTSLQVTFPSTNGGDLYDVRYGTSTGSYTSTISAVTSPYTITGLTTNTTYYVVVTGRNTVGPGANRSTAELQIKTPLVAPFSLVASAVPAQVNLTWSALTGATSYKVYRGTVSGTHALLASGVATASYSDATAANGTTSFYVVRAFNGLDSVDSLEVSSQPIENFTISSITSPSSTSIQVSWPVVTGASSYDVRYGNSTGSYTTTVTGQTSPYTITGLSANSTYYVVIRAKNTIGTGTNVTSSESTQTTAATTPTGLVASATPGQAGLNWNAVTGATSYKVYRGTASGVLSLLASGVASNAYLDTSVANGTTYFQQALELILIQTIRPQMGQPIFMSLKLSTVLIQRTLMKRLLDQLIHSLSLVRRHYHLRVFK
jgi:fibronectin type 3 domain-containing protein